MALRCEFRPSSSCTLAIGGHVLLERLKHRDDEAAQLLQMNAEEQLVAPVRRLAD
jgi:hypothetical protein